MLILPIIFIIGCLTGILMRKEGSVSTYIST